MTEKKYEDGEVIEQANKTQLEGSVEEFVDYEESKILTVTLTGISRKDKPYLVFHRVRVPTNVQLRKYNNKLLRFEQTLRGRRQKKGQDKVVFLSDAGGASEWLWGELIVDVIGYPGGKASVPIDHKRRTIDAVLPDLGGMEEAADVGE